MQADSPVRVAVLGVSGRMGKALLTAVGQMPEMRLAGGLVSPSSATTPRLSARPGMGGISLCWPVDRRLGRW